MALIGLCYSFRQMYCRAVNKFNLSTPDIRFLAGCMDMQSSSWTYISYYCLLDFSIKNIYYMFLNKIFIILNIFYMFLNKIFIVLNRFQAKHDELLYTIQILILCLNMFKMIKILFKDISNRLIRKNLNLIRCLCFHKENMGFICIYVSMQPAMDTYGHIWSCYDMT